jgi:hypothetical protein
MGLHERLGARSLALALAIEPALLRLVFHP